MSPMMPLIRRARGNTLMGRIVLMWQLVLSSVKLWVRAVGP